MSICTKCGDEKVDDDFYVDRGRRTAACKKCIKEHVSSRYHSNPQVQQRAKEVAIRWAECNPEKRKASVIKYVRNPENRPKYNAAYNKRRVKQLGNGGSYSVKEWRDLLKLYGNVCLCCSRSGDEVKLTADHVIPIVLGGSGSIENIQPLCLSCNVRKGVKTTDYRANHVNKS